MTKKSYSTLKYYLHYFALYYHDSLQYVSANDDQLLIERITSYDNITSNNTSLITINTKLDTGNIITAL